MTIDVILNNDIFDMFTPINLRFKHKWISKIYAESGYSSALNRALREGIDMTNGPKRLFERNRDYVFMLVNSLIYQRKYESARYWIDKLDEDLLVEKSKTEYYPGYNMTVYYNLKMKICKELCNNKNAKEIMISVDPDIKDYMERIMLGVEENLKYYKEQTDQVGFMINEIYYLYHFILGNFDIAKEYAEIIQNMKYTNDNHMIIPALMFAELSKASGNRAECEKWMQTAKEKAEARAKFAGWTDAMLYNEYSSKLGVGTRIDTKQKIFIDF